MSDPASYDEQLPDRIENLTIAEAASLSGLSAHTLRYYERIGCLIRWREGRVINVALTRRIWLGWRSFSACE